MRRRCRDCTAFFSGNTGWRCPPCAALATVHENSRRDASRRARGVRTGTSSAHRRARKVAHGRSGGLCESTIETGQRCGRPETAEHPLEAHHLNPVADGGQDGNADELLMCCPGCHVLEGLAQARPG